VWRRTHLYSHTALWVKEDRSETATCSSQGRSLCRLVRAHASPGRSSHAALPSLLAVFEDKLLSSTHSLLSLSARPLLPLPFLPPFIYTTAAEQRMAGAVVMNAPARTAGGMRVSAPRKAVQVGVPRTAPHPSLHSSSGTAKGLQQCGEQHWWWGGGSAVHTSRFFAAGLAAARRIAHPIAAPCGPEHCFACAGVR
jgi:hypothetical protein